MYKTTSQDCVHSGTRLYIKSTRGKEDQVFTIDSYGLVTGDKLLIIYLVYTDL